jgi:hypothetical protein
MKRYANKRDGNEKEIIDALRAIGCSVYQLDRPVDLLIGFRARNLLLECKMPGKENRKDQQEQRDWMKAWNGQVRVVSSVNEAIAVVTSCYE